MAVEIWLRTNVRAVWFGMILPAAVGAVGLALWIGPSVVPHWLRIVGATLLALGTLTFAALCWQLRRARLAYAAGKLLVWLRPGPPIRVPIEVVECFWLGQAPSLLPGKKHERTETAALVIRIAESASDWQRQDVKPQLGKWCEGYITIRGTWCDRLNVELVNRLNERLAEVTRAAKAHSQTAS